jgi:hypothetical protein
MRTRGVLRLVRNDASIPVFVRDALVRIALPLSQHRGYKTAKWHENMLPPHSLLPTGMLLRSFLIAAVSSHRWLLTPSLSVLSFLSKPRKSLLSVENNPILHAIFKKTLYNHFCAGENSAEVTTTIKQIKDMGFRGVILTYAREVVINASGKGSTTNIQQPESFSGDLKAFQDPDIEAWRKGVLETVKMVGQGDYLALK